MGFSQRTSWQRILRLSAALFVLLAICCLAGEAAACPTCKEGLAENDPSSQAMAAGYFYSILFMMSMPFLILGTFGSFAYWSVRKARASCSLGQGSNSSSKAIQSPRA